MAQQEYDAHAFDSLVTVEGTTPEPASATVAPVDEGTGESSTLAAPEDAGTEPPPPSAAAPERDESGRFTAKSETSADSEAAAQIAPKRKESPQDRINKAIAKQRDAERAAQYWQEQAQRSQGAITDARVAADAQKPADQRWQAPTTDAEPQFEQFADAPDPYAAYVRALGRWEARQVLREDRQQQQQAYAQQTQQSRITKHQQDMALLKVQTPEFDSLMEVANATPVTPELSAAILDSDLSARLVLYLAGHADTFDELRSLSGPQLYRRLGRLEASLSGANGSPVQARPQPAITPIQPVGSSPVSATPAPDDLDFGPEYIRQMNKRDRESKGFRF